MNNQNPFKRFAFSPTSDFTLVDGNHYVDPHPSRTVFTGGDMHAYINNIPVTNLESATWSVSVEVVGNYVMGQRDCVTYTTGKRVVVGTLVFSQYDKHAFIEEVFQLSYRNPPLRTYGDLWNMDNNVTANALRNQTASFGTIVKGAGGTLTATVDPNALNSQGVDPKARGLTGVSPQDFNRFLQEALTNTARLVGATQINYSDQIPPFDLTLVGVTRNGLASKCSIYGIQVTQETAGVSSNDLSNSVGLSFVALAVTPWKAVEAVGSTVIIPGAS